MIFTGQITFFKDLWVPAAVSQTNKCKIQLVSFHEIFTPESFLSSCEVAISSAKHTYRVGKAITLVEHRNWLLNLCILSTYITSILFFALMKCFYTQLWGFMQRHWCGLLSLCRQTKVTCWAFNTTDYWSDLQTM